ncbi:MAG: tol-pal system protein YbgF [Pseudomonadota bacterium]
MRSSTSTERSHWLRSNVTLAVLLLASASAGAANPNTARIDELEARMDRVDRVVSNQSLTEMSQRLDALQAEMRTQQGRIEELQNENEQLKRQQRDLYADLEKRLQAASAGPTAAAAETGVTPRVGAAPDAGEQAQYQRAMDALKARDYAAATEGFRSLAATFPQGEMADNTQYWLGESYYVTQEYDHAAAAFQHVLSGWPNSRKVPDAMLKLGYTQIEQKKIGPARTTLQQVVDKFPGTDAAKLAADRLAKLPAQ